MTRFKNRLLSYSPYNKFPIQTPTRARGRTTAPTFFPIQFFPPFVIILHTMNRWRCVRVYITYISFNAYSHYFAYSDGHLNTISVGIYTHTRLQFIPNTVCYFDLFCKNVPIIYRNYRGNSIC